MKIIVTTQPFKNNQYLTKLSNQGHNICFNETGKKYSQDDVDDLLELEQPDIVIAGTEAYSTAQISLCSSLKMISRAGIGLDSVDLQTCKRQGVVVTNTPGIHAEPVAEFMLAQTLNGLRRIALTNTQISKGKWKRKPSRSLTECKIGLFGFGAVGQALFEKLEALGANDIAIRDPFMKLDQFRVEEMASSCDIILIAMPLTEDTKDMFNEAVLSLAKDDAILVNASRGGIVNEDALYDWLAKAPDRQAFIDVFKSEPYSGPLQSLDNAILTPHAAGSTIKARALMELTASEAVYNFIHGEPLKHEVKYD